MTIRLHPKKIPLYAVLIALTLLWLLPVASSLLVALKSSQDFVSQTWADLPTKIKFFTNLATVLREYRLLDNLGSSVLYASVGTVVVILAASMAGYSIVRLRPKFNFLLFLIIYSGTLFPFQMYLIPVYRVFNALGLYDTRTTQLWGGIAYPVKPNGCTFVPCTWHRVYTDETATDWVLAPGGPENIANLPFVVFCHEVSESGARLTFGE